MTGNFCGDGVHWLLRFQYGIDHLIYSTVITLTIIHYRLISIAGIYFYSCFDLRAGNLHVRISPRRELSAP
jgi:hypothetical protein